MGRHEHEKRHILRAVYTVQNIVYFQVIKRGRVSVNHINIGYEYSIVGIEYTVLSRNLD